MTPDLLKRFMLAIETEDQKGLLEVLREAQRAGHLRTLTDEQMRDVAASFGFRLKKKREKWIRDTAYEIYEANRLNAPDDQHMAFSTALYQAADMWDASQQFFSRPLEEQKVPW